MRRKLTGIPFFFFKLHQQVHLYHTKQYFKNPFQFMLPHSKITTTSSITIFKTPNFSINPNPKPLILYASFSSSSNESESDPDDEFTHDKGQTDPGSSSRDLETITDILRTGGVQEKSKNFEQCGVKATPFLVVDVLSRTRNDWETAFTFFLWAGKQPSYEHSLREYHSMIAILGKFRKFDTAWSLIDDMRAASLVTPHTLLIMIRKYAAVHDVAKAISAFYAHKRFKLEVRMEEFQGMLSALCRYKNVKDAEHLLFCNKTVFPLNTKSFNIILNGYCNVVGDQREGKRIWKEMEMRGVRHDVYSYASIMSCYSKASNLNLVLRLFDKMKALRIEPDRKVYNALVHALAKGRLVEEARGIMKTMEEKGFTPDTITYNSLIMPLCKFQLLDEAKDMLHEMIERGLSPNIRTYHAFFRILRTGEEVFELLEKMYATGCHPSHDTYIMLIRKFCRWRQLDDVFKLWNEMNKNGLDPDRSSYIVLIHGLFLNGKLEEAHKYFLEMKEKHLLPEPKIDEIIQAWLSGKTEADWPSTNLKDSQTACSVLKHKDRVESKRNYRDHDFRHQPELRNVVREGGFSFWDS